MDLLLTLIVLLVVVGLAYWALHRLATAFGIPAPIVTVIDVILVVIVVFYLLRIFGVGGRLALP